MMRNYAIKTVVVLILALSVLGSRDLHVSDAEEVVNVVKTTAEEDSTVVEDFMAAVASQNVTLVNDTLIAMPKEITTEVLTDALHKSVAYGLEVPELLVTEYVSYNVTDNMGDTPLHLAVKSGNVELCKFLIEKGSDVNALNKKGETPLLCGSGEYCNEDVTVVLIKAGADLEIKESGQTALERNSYYPQCFNASNALINAGATYSAWSAVHSGNLTIIESMLKSGDLDLDKTRENTIMIPAQPPSKGIESALVIAAYTGHIKVVEFFIEEGAQLDILQNEAISMAARYKKFEVVEALLNAGAEVPVYILTDMMALNNFCDGGYLIPMFFEARDNIDTRDSLFKAIFYNCYEILESLAKYKQKVNLDSVDEDNMRAIGKAVEPFEGILDARRAIAGILVEMGAESDIYVSAFLNDTKAVQQFLAQGAEVDGAPISTPIYNQTPLYISSALGYLDVMEILIDAGAKLEKYETSENKTSLMAAAQYGQVAAAKLLLDSGANVNATGAVFKDMPSGNSTLIIATTANNTEMVETLVSYDADINYKNSFNQTALMIATYNANPDIVCLLLQNGAAIDIRDADMHTAYDVAVINYHNAVSGILYMVEEDPKNLSGICA